MNNDIVFNNARVEQQCAPPEAQTRIVKESLEVLAQPV